MSIVQRHLEIDQRWGTLPAVTTVASFNFFDQSIVFSLYSTDDLRQALQEKLSKLKVENVASLYMTAFHEYRHWIDLTSSTYGLGRLTRLMSVNELIKAGDEGNLKRACRSASQFAVEIHLPQYYSVSYGLHDDRPWHYRTTVGRAYTTEGTISDNHPIWFIHFLDAKDRPIARQPISIASLLECRAVEAEISLANGLLLKAAERVEGYKGEASQQFSENMLSRVYAPSLTLYSAAAHWHANSRGSTDMVCAYNDI